jgi:murein DD-endopeptidase MepM/ murein hydrolase activator NlpD
MARLIDPDHWAARDIRREAELIEARRETAALATQYQSIIGGLRAADENFIARKLIALSASLASLAVDRS